MNKRISRLLLIVLIFGSMATLVGTQAYARPKANEVSTFGLQKMMGDKVTQTMSNIGNWGFWVNYEGLTGHDPFTGSAGGYYPRGVMTAIYADGFIWGGYLKQNGVAVSDTPTVGGIGYYRVGTTPGWIQDDGTPVSPDDPRVRIYRIRDDWRSLTASQVLQEATELYNVPVNGVTDAMTSAIIAQYAADWKNWPVDLGAPYYDVNHNGKYDPVLDKDGYPIKAKYDKDGNLVEGGDYPGIAQADQTIWLVVNDLNESKMLNLSGSKPIGIEVQITLWAYNQPGNTLGQIVFKRYKMINKSGYTIDSMFVAQFSDPDVGDYSDDLVGCDTTLSLHFAYNGSPVDAEYAKVNLPPPAVGFDFFQGPLVPGAPTDSAVSNLQRVYGYKNLPMTSFGYFSAGGSISDPPMGRIEFTLQWYNMLNGYEPTNDLKNPTPYVIGSGPKKGTPSKFPLYGDPVKDPNATEGDIDGQGDNMGPGDRRMFACTGPFTMKPGDAQEIVVALVGGMGGTNIQSIADLKSTDNVAQKVYDDLFRVIPKPPTPPDVKVTPFENKISLNWGWNADRIKDTETRKIINYKFEGYNVYQLPSATSKLSDPGVVRIATYDVIDGVRIIKSQVFSAKYGTVVNLPIQFGSDSGIKRFFVVDKDYITGKPLYRGSTYYFAVTAYNYDGSLVRDRALESAPIIHAVTVQNPKPGYKYDGEAGESITVDHTSGNSDGKVDVIIVDPSELTGHDYKVTFTEDTDTSSATYGQIFWNLIDVTDNNREVLTMQKQISPTESGSDAPIVEGFQIKVFGPPPGINPSRYGVAYGEGSQTSMTYLQGWDFSGTRWISGTDAGGIGLFGGLFNGFDFFGSTAKPSDFSDVVLKWAGTNSRSDSTAEGLAAASQSEEPDRWSKAAVYRRDLGWPYPYDGTGMIPFSAWDVDHNRRLNVCFVEDANNGSANKLWDMGWDGSKFADLGGREYIFIMASDYDEAKEYNDDNWGPASDVLYAIWPSKRGNHPYLEANFELMVFASKVNTSEDVFEFSVPGKTENDKKLAKADVEKINVFPNPYYAANPQEPDRFNRFVTFNHLPQHAIIRIFTLGGVQVRKLEKNDDTQFFRWDLKNEAGLPVASGLYIAYIDMPELGKTKTLKLMIVQGEQVVEFY